jgi:hypothetical protein
MQRRTAGPPWPYCPSEASKGSAQVQSTAVGNPLSSRFSLPWIISYGPLESGSKNRTTETSDGAWRAYRLEPTVMRRDNTRASRPPFKYARDIVALGPAFSVVAFKDCIGWPCSAVSWMRLRPGRDGGRRGRGSAGPHWRSPSSASIGPSHDGPALQVVRGREQKDDYHTK